MQVELNQAEIEMIDHALKAWESQANADGLMSSILTAVLVPENKREEFRARDDEKMAKAERETTHRRMKATMLRAKLFQSLTDSLTASQ